MKKIRCIASLLMAFTLMAGQIMPVMAEGLEGGGFETEAAADIEMPNRILIHSDSDHHFYIPSTNYFKYNDGIYYYNVSSCHKNISDKDKIYSNVLEDRTSQFIGYDRADRGFSTNVLGKWADVGRCIMENSGIDHQDVEHDRGYGWTHGAVTANSLEKAENKAIDMMDAFKIEGRALRNETKQQNVIAWFDAFEPIGAYDSHSYLGVYLYNFRVTPVLNDNYLKWAGDNRKLNVINNVDEKATTGIGAKNETPIPVRNDQWIQIQKSQSQTKENNGSTSHSFTESIKVNVEGTIKGIVKLGTELGFSATQAFSSGWSDSKSTTYSEAKNTTQSVTLPGYTGVNMEQAINKGEYKIDVDTPVAISYDVKMVYYGTEKTSTRNPSVFATFEGDKHRDSTDAQSDLLQRVYNGKENQGLRYLSDKNGQNKFAYTPKDTINQVAYFVPYFTAEKTENKGALNDTVMTANGFIPLHPLKSVDTVKDKRDTEIKKGSQIYLRDIQLAGYLDKQYSDGEGGTAKYATFNARQGHWEITGGDNIVKIDTDSQKNQILTGLKEGTAEITYKIDEDCYNSAENRQKITKNSDLSSTAVYRIKVSKSKKASATLYDVNVLTQNSVSQAEETTPWSIAAADSSVIGSTEEGAPAINAIRLNSQNPDLVNIECTTQMISGQQMTAAPGTVAGDESRQDAIEALSLQNLKGDEDMSDICYRVYVPGEGWTNWARNGELAGSHGYGKAITAVQVALVGNYESAPAEGNELEAAYLAAPGYGQINYSADGIQAMDGEVLGDPDGDSLLGDITVTTDPTAAGPGVSLTTEGEGKTEAITMNLTGDKAAEYDLYYRVNSETTGWMNWAEDGEKAGTGGLDQGIKAVQVIMAKKGETLNQNNYSYDTIATYEQKQPDSEPDPVQEDVVTEPENTIVQPETTIMKQEQTAAPAESTKMMSTGSSKAGNVKTGIETDATAAVVAALLLLAVGGVTAAVVLRKR